MASPSGQPASSSTSTAARSSAPIHAPPRSTSPAAATERSAVGMPAVDEAEHAPW